MAEVFQLIWISSYIDWYLNIFLILCIWDKMKSDEIRNHFQKKYWNFDDVLIFMQHIKMTLSNMIAKGNWINSHILFLFHPNLKPDDIKKGHVFVLFFRTCNHFHKWVIRARLRVTWYVSHGPYLAMLEQRKTKPSIWSFLGI